MLYIGQYKYRGNNYGSNIQKKKVLYGESER